MTFFLLLIIASVYLRIRKNSQTWNKSERQVRIVKLKPEELEKSARPEPQNGEQSQESAKHANTYSLFTFPDTLSPNLSVLSPCVPSVLISFASKRNHFFQSLQCSTQTRIEYIKPHFGLDTKWESECCKSCIIATTTCFWIGYCELCEGFFMPGLIQLNLQHLV